MEQLNVTWELEQRLYEDNIKRREETSAAELVVKYGEDSLAYLTLEEGKQYFFGEDTEGFISYVVVEKVAVCVGNSVCSKDSTTELLQEFEQFCRKRRYKICFCSVTKEMAEVLKQRGFSISKYGEEALLDLRVYELSGSKTSKLRQKLKRAEKSGINIIEYRPKEERDLELEKKIHKVSEEWFAKKNGKLTFTLGELNLDNPLGRRYFVALGEGEEVQAILMFSPFGSGKGYFLDVMRRTESSVPGVMEKAIIDAAMQFKSEGAEWVSLGLAPLSGIEIEKGKSTVLEKGMNFMYNNMNKHYGFKTLHDYKKKFAPTNWEPRYVAHEQNLLPFKVAYVMIKARNVDDMWKQLLEGLWKAGRAFLTVDKKKQ